MEGVGEEFCCNSQYRYMLIHHLHKKLKSIWACCAAAPTGSTSALVASHGCSTRGPAATHVEVLSSSILQVCETLLWTMWCGTDIWIPFVQFRYICACGLQSVCHTCMHISRHHTETRQTQPTSPLSVPKPNTSILYPRCCPSGRWIEALLWSTSLMTPSQGHNPLACRPPNGPNNRSCRSLRRYGCLILIYPRHRGMVCQT